MTLVQLLLLAAAGLVAASFLRLTQKITVLLATEKKLTEGLSVSLLKLSQRCESAETIAASSQAQVADLLSTVTALRHQNSEIAFLREQVNLAHDRLLSLHSRGALAAVRNFKDGGLRDERPPDGFSAYPTEDSPIDTVRIPTHRPPVGRETVVVPRERPDSPDGYGEGGAVVLDQKTEQFLFGG